MLVCQPGGRASKRGTEIASSTKAQLSHTTGSVVVVEVEVDGSVIVVVVEVDAVDGIVTVLVGGGVGPGGVGQGGHRPVRSQHGPCKKVPLPHVLTLSSHIPAMYVGSPGFPT